MDTLRRGVGRALAAWLTLAGAAACWPTRATGPAPSGPADGLVLARQALATGDYVGLSDLAYDPHGRLWSLPERQRALLPLAVEGGVPGLAAPPVPLIGVPEAYDTEAFAWVDAEVVAVGTETTVAARQSDDIFLAKVSGGEARVFDSVRMAYQMWDMRAVSNRGIEGLCAADGFLLAAGETSVRLPGGERAAPLGRLRLADRSWSAFWLPLASGEGNISALACRAAGDGLDVWAVERHFGVTLLRAAHLPRGATGGRIAARTWADLGVALEGALPNVEGIASAGRGQPAYLVTDNHYGRVTGPTWLFRLCPLPAP